MNYLLFVYYNTDVKNSEEKTQEIGGLISDVMTSKEIRRVFKITLINIYEGQKYRSTNQSG